MRERNTTLKHPKNKKKKLKKLSSQQQDFVRWAIYLSLRRAVNSEENIFDF